MTRTHLLFAVFWMAISCSFSLTWSSAVNSLFSAKGFKPQSVGVSRDLMETVANGAQIAMLQCQNVFKWDRWNCPESAFSKRSRHLATKEQAVAHAILSAGLVHAVTRNCSRSRLKGCGCDPKFYRTVPTNAPYITEKGINALPKKDWSWGGCSDDVEYGQAIAQTVLDEQEQGADAQTYVNLHNNLVGRTIVRNTMEKVCRCHGVSGSCVMKTCWMQVAPFENIANAIRHRYKNAVRVEYENNANAVSVKSSSKRMTTDKISQVRPTQLVFLQKSPNYCRANNATGWLGTKGRECSRSRSGTRSPAEKRSCRNLCVRCGHRVRKHTRQITKDCNCQFHWCCEVRCDKCTETVEEFFCE